MATNIPITESPPPSVTQLIRTHRKIHALCRGALPERVIAELSETSFKIGFEIMLAPARNADEISAKLDFALADIANGEAIGFVDAVSAGIRADLQRMEAANV